MNKDRRVFCATMLGAASIGALGTVARGAYDGQERDQFSKAFSRSGNDEMDAALIAELKRIVSVFQINPGFKYISDMNAYAMIEARVPGTTDGTVMLGLPLIEQLMRQADGGAAVAGVCAHECAHVYQNKVGLSELLRAGSPSILRSELHADYMAGYYMSRRKEFVPDKIRVFSAAAYSMGDYASKNSDSHGTPGQRAGAVDSGYKVGLDGVDLTKAGELGLAFVSTL